MGRDRAWPITLFESFRPHRSPFARIKRNGASIDGTVGWIGPVKTVSDDGVWGRTGNGGDTVRDADLWRFDRRQHSGCLDFRRRRDNQRQTERNLQDDPQKHLPLAAWQSQHINASY